MSRRSRQMTKSKAHRLKYRQTHTRGWMARLRKDLRAKGQMTPKPVK